MPHPRGETQPFSRRQVLEGGLALGLIALTGCAGRAGEDAARTEAPLNPPNSNPPSPVPPILYPPNTVLPRSAWAKAGVLWAENLRPMDGIDRITVHHAGMTAFTSIDQAATASRIELVRQTHIQRKARDGKGWSDIGYHYIIDPAGRVWEGRDIRYQGAHVEFNNEHNLGIMCLGHYGMQQPTERLKDTLDRFLAEQMCRYRVPIARVFTHREIRDCENPGTHLQAYMVQTRGEAGALRRTVARANPTLA